jgi:mRNA interferase MazF
MTTMTKSKLVYKRGDVALVLFPNADLHTAKLRPALIVQADGLGTGLNQVIVVMITSRLFRANHPSRITILLRSPEGKRSGLLSDSVVMTDNVATVTETALDRIIGSLSMNQVDIALRHTLGLRG